MKLKKKKGTAKAQTVKHDIREYYYMIPEETAVKNLAAAITSFASDQVELWNELDLMEVVLTKDSLIFQNAKDVFEDPLDLEYIKENGIKTIYQISFDAEDIEDVRKVFSDLLNATNGMLCSDSDDFEPVYKKETISELSL